MRKILLTVAIILVAFSSKGQLNNISSDEVFEAIKFDGVSLGDVMKSSGDLNQVKLFFGNDIQGSPNNTGPFLAKEFRNSDIYLHFEDETNSGDDYHLTYINVKSAEVIVIILGTSIRLGDSKSKLSQYTFNDSINEYVFTDKTTGSLSLSFKIDDTTNTISEIEFIAF